MKSLTKAKVTVDQIKEATNACLDCNVLDYMELNDGFYNISYLVKLDDNSEVVLKIAPPKDVEILTYEKDIIITELLFYKLAFEHTDIKVPEILAEDFSCEIIDSPYYFMSKLEGIPLNKLENITPDMRKQVYTVIAEYIAKLHNINGEMFGYITMEDKCAGKDCLNSIIVSVEALMNDAKRKDMILPLSKDEIFDVLNECNVAFNEIRYPVVCHFDLWDGNIFVCTNDKKLDVTGIIDFERGFYGCPAADLCQAMGYIDLEKDVYFLETYNKFANKKVAYNNELKIRILAYRFYLFLIMIVECDYRDVDGSFEPQREWVTRDIKIIYDNLKKAIDDMVK